MKTVCERNKCAGCMACIDICSQQAIQIKDSIFAYNAVIDDDLCINCNACKIVCQANHPAMDRKPIIWNQAWAQNESIRQQGSSGGVATALMKSFIKEDGCVCSCAFEDGIFGFQIINSLDDTYKFSGSKYVKSNPVGAYKSVKKHLTNNKKVLFIGLPCQISSLKNYVGEKLQKNLWTVDLICHGSPSPQILNHFLRQHRYDLNCLKDIRFRKKTNFQLFDFDQKENKYRDLIGKGEMDKYLIAFLNCACYTDNCYSCNYAKIERVADITLGDSWGSDQPKDEIGKGVSLVLCQTKKGVELIEKSELVLKAVDLNKAIDRNHQLKEPSHMPSNRNALLHGVIRGEKFDVLMWRYFPKQCLKQKIKKYMIKLHLLRRNLSYGTGDKR